MATENDLVQRFIENERKSKQATLLFVIIFIVAAISILFLAHQINMKEKEIVKKEEELSDKNQAIEILKLSAAEYQRIIDSLSKVITRPFEIKDSMNNKRTEELVKEVKVREVLIEKVKVDIDSNLMSQSRQSLQREIMMVQANSAKILRPQRSYTVYIQYNGSNNGEATQIAELRKNLEALGYNVPEAEFIKRPFSSTYVCYFHPEDSVYAKEILEKFRLSNRDAGFIKMQKKSPKKQVEIWLNSK